MMQIEGFKPVAPWVSITGCHCDVKVAGRIVRRDVPDRTCCPISSSLRGTAARQRTVESPRTMDPSRQREHRNREGMVSLPASGGAGARLDGMVNTRELSLNVVR